MAELQLYNEASDDEAESVSTTSKCQEHTSKLKKSGRVRTADEIILRDVEWPH